MFVKDLHCPRCGASYDSEVIQQLCSCGSPLLVRYDLDAVRISVDRAGLRNREPDLWRYRELLPVKRRENVVSFGEGMTPMLELKKVGARAGIKRLYMKDEGIIPTGTFKARGAGVGVTRARVLGVRALAMRTNGDAGGAWALYCASAGIESVIVMPRDAPPIPRKECIVAGSSLFLVNGLISDAGKIIAGGVKKHGWYDASTLKEPYRIEGKKTMGLEIAEQFGWEVPDVILYPTGGGVGIIGIYKALTELRQLGWIGDKMPRLVSVQAAGCAPIVKAWEQNLIESTFWENSSTVAFGINVPKALGDFLVLEAVYATKGCAIAVDDGEIMKAHALLGREEGAFVCPEGAATYAAAEKLVKQGWIKPDESVVLLNTGTGLKYPESVDAELTVLEPGAEIPV